MKINIKILIAILAFAIVITSSIYILAPKKSPATFNTSRVNLSELNPGFDK